MQAQPNTTEDMGLPFYDPRGERYPRLDDPTAPGYQRGEVHMDLTAPESPIGLDPGGSVSNTAGSAADTSEWGTEDTGTGETTSANARRVQTRRRRAVPIGNATQSAKTGRRPLLRLASLNVRGCGSLKTSGTPKLLRIARWMRDRKLAVLGLQETYKCEGVLRDLETTLERAWAFPNPGTAHSKGTGFILNREALPSGMTKDDVSHMVLIPGRADMISFIWGSERIKIANVYAPNGDGEAINFFTKLTKELKREKPDVVLGDWNHVESEIDRIPRGKIPPMGIRLALAKLREEVGVDDAWRNSNLSENGYTWEGSHANNDGTVSRSRIDRILMTNNMEDRTVEHTINDSLQISDHWAVIAKIVDSESPYIGPSRWRMNLEDVEDETLQEQCRSILTKCEDGLGNNPMQAWLDAKKKIQNETSQRQNMRRKDRGKRLANLRQTKENLQKTAGFTTNPGLQKMESAVRDRIAELEKGKLERATESSRARFADKGESVNKFWFSIGKSMKESSTIRSLKDENDRPTRETDEMVRIATRHHAGLQSKPAITDERKSAIHKMALLARGKELPSEARSELARRYSREDAEEAIRTVQTGKAPGKDGIPYEFYKYWVKRWDNRKDDGPKIPDIALIMARVWNSVPDKDKAPGEYTEGLMFLLYKKKERDRIANYRPITLLNSDYKLQTKVLASRLGKVVGHSIHPDQAGFVPGRDILDHVRLAQVVKELCDTEERNGCLVALDQEKAYDRIDHEYLWAILEAYALLDRFIKTVKALYRNARTAVIVNQTSPSQFRVERGVRQGDPLSCLLFDLAIEPMAEALRRSPLKGISIPGAVQRLVVRLFADDTQVYLSESDKWTTVKRVTEEWCLASTAKFNVEKTEFLPMGSASYRKAMVQVKCLQPGRIRTAEVLPRTAHFVRDTEPLRILGGQVGRNLDDNALWDGVVSRIETLADKWSKRRMTMKGRRLIASFLIQSRAQYLMMTNPPPKEAVKRIAKATHRVMWRGKTRGSTKMSVVEQKVEEGGMSLL